MNLELVNRLEQIKADLATILQDESIEIQTFRNIEDAKELIATAIERLDREDRQT